MKIRCFGMLHQHIQKRISEELIYLFNIQDLTLTSRELLGEKHSDVATSLYALAEVLYSQGKYKEAEAVYREEVALNSELLGEKHEDVIASMRTLGLVLSLQDKYKEAQDLIEQALQPL